jgi:guanine nucleotide-binding protein G(i) subunit alpha
MHACSFFAEAQRIVAEDYVPSIEDILHASEKGIVKTHFNCGQLSIRILHVHDQRSDFEKWIHLFEGVTTVIFCVFLAGYDEPSGVSPQVCVPRFVLLLISCVTTSRRRN